jgi:hypothetical protein
MRKKNSDFDKICNFVNNIPKENTYRTHIMLDACGGYPINDTVSRYQTILKRLDFIEHVKHGMWKVKHHVPSWFTTAHAHVVLGMGRWNPITRTYNYTTGGMTKEDILFKLKSELEPDSPLKKKVEEFKKELDSYKNEGACGCAGSTGTIGVKGVSPCKTPDTYLKEDKWPYENAYEVKYSTAGTILGYEKLNPDFLYKSVRMDGHIRWIYFEHNRASRIFENSQIVSKLPEDDKSLIKEIDGLSALASYVKKMGIEMSNLLDTKPPKILKPTLEDRILNLEEEMIKATKYTEYVRDGVEDILQFLEKTAFNINELLKKIDNRTK